MSLGGLIGGGLGWLAGGPAGAAVGAQIGGGFDTNQANAASASQAQDFSAQQYATRYQTQVADMKAAGLNPMLAYQQSPGSSPTGVTYTSVNPYANSAQAYSSTKNLDNAGNLMDAQAKHAEASAGQARSNEALANRTAEKVVQEVVNLKTDNERAKAVIDNLAKEGQNLLKQNWNLTEIGNQLRASISKINAEITHMGYQNVLLEAQQILAGSQNQLMGYDITAAKDMGNIGREAGQLKPIFDFIRMFLPRR